MNGLRRALSAGAVGGILVLSALVVGATPAASGEQARSSPLLAHGTLTQSVQVLEGVAPGAIRRVEGIGGLDTRLSSLVRPANVWAGRNLDADTLERTADGRVRVVVEASDSVAARTAVEKNGGRVERTWRNLVQAVVQPSSLTALSRAPGVTRVRAPFVMVEHAIPGEEVALDGVPAWQAKGFTGKGVKVAIIDGGFKGLAERQAEGELPASVVTQDMCGGRFSTETEHGTAVAEIVHEMAPDAQLYLVCVATEVDLANAETYAKSQGVQVVNHSAGWFGPSRGDGSGPIGAVAADARASGILWVNSAGNEAVTHWSGTFNDPDVDRMHEWAASGDEGNTFVWPNGEVVCGFLKWDEWPTGVSDFDLGLFLSSSNTPVGVSAEEQNGSQPPFEGLCMQQTTGTNLLAFWAIGGYRVTTSPRIDLFSEPTPLQYSTAAGSIGDPATSSSAFAVGALCWQSRSLEFYSSQGPTIDGRIKPDIAGHDSVSGATYGAYGGGCPSAFAGTSAASPEVAGAAALVRQAYPAYGPAQLQAYLQQRSLDVGTPGPDNATGAGELQMGAAPDVVAPKATALPSTGRLGKTVKLLSRVSDDSGSVRVTEQVKRGSRVVATIVRRGFVSASAPTTVSVAWRAPAKANGTYQHCVRATDSGGNVSKPSCAKVRLK